MPPVRWYVGGLTWSQEAQGRSTCRTQHGLSARCSPVFFPLPLLITCFCWTSGRVLFRCLCNVRPNTFLLTWNLRRNAPSVPPPPSIYRSTERRWCCTDGQRNSILPGRRTGQTGTCRNLLKEMRLDFCTGQISLLLHHNIFPLLPSSTTGQWLGFPIQNNWFSRCFQADLMLGEPNIWYGLSSTKQQNYYFWTVGSRTLNSQSLKWDVPWLDHLLIIWPYHHLNKSSSCLHHITPHVQDTRAQSPSGKRWRLCFQPAVGNKPSSAPAAENRF